VDVKDIIRAGIGGHFKLASYEYDLKNRLEKEMEKNN
jgi:hypothetical protein